MGEIADSMINGELCEWCGVYLEPGETVYQQTAKEGEFMELEMPEDGSGPGFPVVCSGCKDQ